MNYLFWILCALIIVIALLFVVLPLWRNKSSSNEVLRDAANIEIFRDQINEMDNDLRNGLLTRELHEQGKREIQARLLEEVKSGEQSVLQVGNSKVLAVTLALLLPLFSVPLYLHLGNHYAALPPDQKIEADSSGIISSEAGVRALETQLKKKPKDANGWFMLANSYISQKKYAEAVNAYAELVELVPDEAQVWANYADVYGMANGQSLQGEKVAEFLQRALSIDPNNSTALALSGSAGMQGGDFVKAITHWQKLLDKLPPASQDAQLFGRSLQRAKDMLAAQPGGKEKLAQLSAQQAALAAEAANPAAAITGDVALSPAMKSKVAPTDTVFVLARAAQGPKMPLAVFRKQVKDLPLKFSLDDSMAMQPQLKLSGFDQVVVVARVSKSGTPMAQPGDLEGLSGPVKPGSKGLNIVIDTVVQ